MYDEFKVEHCSRYDGGEGKDRAVGLIFFFSSRMFFCSMAEDVAGERESK